MIDHLRESWQAFRESAPGQRFMDRYERRQAAEHGRWTLGAVLRIAVGVAIAIAGVVLIPAPGPGWIVAGLGAGLVGSEFAPIARALDGAEVRLRGGAHWARARWHHASTGGKVLLAGAGLCVLALGAYGVYRVVAG